MINNDKKSLKLIDFNTAKDNSGSTFSQNIETPNT